MKLAKQKQKRNLEKDLKIKKLYKNQNKLAQQAGLDPKGSNNQLLNLLGETP